MLALTVLLLAGQIGSPQGIHLLDDVPLMAQVAPPLIPSLEPQPQSDAQVSAQQLQVDIDALKKQRPAIGGGITLVAIGGSIAVLGALYLAVSSIAIFGTGTGINVFLVLGGVGLGIGLPLVAIGVWLLYNRLEERKHIDEETTRLKKELQLRPRPLAPNPPPAVDLPAPQVRGPEATLLIARFD